MEETKEVTIPSDLGFDSSKFKEYRPGQLELAQKCASSQKLLFLAEAPTGSGKSLAGLTAQKLIGTKKAAYICLTKNNKIRTVRGLISIENINKGDMVLTSNGKYEKVIDKNSKFYEGPVIRIHTSYHGFEPLETTPEHLIRITPNYHSTRIPKSELSWKLGGWEAALGVKKWKYSAYLCYPLLKEIINLTYIQDNNKSWELSNELLALIAWFITEGTVAGPHDSQVNFHLGSHEPKNISEVSNLIYKVIEKPARIKIDGSTALIQVYSKALSNFLINQCKRGAHNKEIPNWIMSLPKDKQKLFISTLVKGDGNKSKRGRCKTNQVSYRTVSLQLAGQVRDMAFRLGYLAGVSITTRGDHLWKSGIITKGPRISYNIRFNEVGSSSKDHRGYNDKENFAYLKILKVEEVNYSGLVYDLTVENTSDFSTSSGCVHNCGTKQLQDQIEADFHLPVLKGRNNYACLRFEKLFPEVNSEICREYLGDDKCSLEPVCPYLIAKRKALSAECCILNYPLFLTEANYVGGLSGMDFLILDECDLLEGSLMSFIEVRVSDRIIGKFNLGHPEFKTKFESWKEWAKTSADKICSSFPRQESTNEDKSSKMSLRALRDLIHLKRAYKKIKFLSEALDDTWVMEEESERNSLSHPSMTFKPVKIDSFAKSTLWDHATKFLGMSATIMGPSAMAIDLGLKSWEADYAELPCPFPVKDRIVNYVPVANVTYKTKDEAYPKLADGINRILKKYPEHKTLIHAVSYDLTKYLVANVRSDTHAIMFHNRENRAMTLENFKSYNGPAALISPSMERGVDLPGDLTRIVIVAKLPFPSLSSPQVNKRLHGFSDGGLWYARKTAGNLVQMTGRATRFLGDWSISYILDQQFERLVSNNGNIFPSWWRLAVQSGSI